jgi:uncharacterized protein YbaR (Trm112 family)
LCANMQICYISHNLTLSSRLQEVVSSVVCKHANLLHFPQSHSQFKIAGGGILSCVHTCKFATFSTLSLSVKDCRRWYPQLCANLQICYIFHSLPLSSRLQEVVSSVVCKHSNCLPFLLSNSQIKIAGGVILSCMQTCKFAKFSTISLSVQDCRRWYPQLCANLQICYIFYSLTLSSRLQEVVSSVVCKLANFLCFPLSHFSSRFQEVVYSVVRKHANLPFSTLSLSVLNFLLFPRTLSDQDCRRWYPHLWVNIPILYIFHSLPLSSSLQEMESSVAN